MINRIGEVAGEVYRTLESKGQLSATKLKKEVGESEFLVNAAIGWLAREDKIKFDKKGNSLLISLQ